MGFCQALERGEYVAGRPGTTSCQTSSASWRSRNRCFPRESAVTPEGRAHLPALREWQGEKHLAAMARGEEPRQPVERWGKVVTTRRGFGGPMCRPIRTRIRFFSGQGSALSARCASTAAATPSEGSAKAA